MGSVKSSVSSVGLIKSSGSSVPGSECGRRISRRSDKIVIWQETPLSHRGTRLSRRTHRQRWTHWGVLVSLWKVFVMVCGQEIKYEYNSVKDFVLVAQKKVVFSIGSSSHWPPILREGPLVSWMCLQYHFIIFPAFRGMIWCYSHLHCSVLTIRSASAAHDSKLVIWINILDNLTYFFISCIINVMLFLIIKVIILLYMYNPQNLRIAIFKNRRHRRVIVASSRRCCQAA